MFLTKDNKIKKNYLSAVDLILTAKPKHTIVTTGRHDEFVEEYDCYESEGFHLTKKNQNVLNHFKEICDYYGFKVHCWYSWYTCYPEILSTNIDIMLNELKRLRGEINCSTDK